MKYQICLIITIMSLLVGCQQGASSATTKPLTTGATSATVLPPKYLTIKDFQTCLSSKTQGSAQFWCLPKKQPAKCENSSWQQLNKLTGSDAIPAC